VPEEEATMVQLKEHTKAAVLSQTTNAGAFTDASTADFEKMIGGKPGAPVTSTAAPAATMDANPPDVPPPVMAATESWKPPAAGAPEFKYEFQPEFRKLAKPPPVSGTKASYLTKAGSAKAAAVLAEDKEIAASEQAAALKQAEADSEKAREVQALQNEKNEVETLMNTAAAGAAAYKTAKMIHDKMVLAEKQAKEAEDAQKKVVKEVEAELAKQKNILMAKAKELAAAKKAEMHSRFKAEFKGHQYVKARDAAIKADNDYREKEHEEVKKQKFREVAEKAVAKEAQREAAEEAKSAKEAGAAIADSASDQDEDVVAAPETTPAPAPPAVVPAPAPVPAPAAAGCSDCTELPDIYTNAGGSCDDCAEWAKKGECALDAYKDFMSRYCAKSCGCKLTVAAETTALLSMPPKAKA
jgi:hypothetical protein